MKTSLEELDYQLIKAHVLAPEQSPLTPDQQFRFTRVMSIARVMDKNPILKHATALHMAKFPEISRTQAYEDASIARKLFNTIHKFDFDFWQTWAINDIVENIRQARNEGSPASRRVIAMEHANLIKVLGDKPEVVTDPRLTEQHEFYIVIQGQNGNMKIDYNLLKQLPPESLRELNNVLFKAQEITDVEAEEIMKS
jgi:hypothetical protein